LNDRRTGNSKFFKNISVITAAEMKVSRMDNKVIRFVGIKDQVEINKDSQAEFLFQYQKAVLLALSEQGVISEFQCRQCIDKLTGQFKK